MLERPTSRSILRFRKAQRSEVCTKIGEIIQIFVKVRNVSTAAKSLRDSTEGFHFLTFCRTFSGALGRTRTCDLLIRRHS